MRYLVAFDKFKDCMSAERACEVAKTAILRASPSAEVETAPLTDGGEGFCRILTRAVGGRFETVSVTGPCGEARDASVGFVNIGSLPEQVRGTLELDTQSGELAVVEMAEASGLWCVPNDRRDPWKATSRGTGEMIAYAAKRGAKGILLGIGGSATCDLGLGALEALGLGCVAGSVSVHGIVPERWSALTDFRGEIMPLPPIYVACDVANPLLGAAGAAAVFGPQKGLMLSDVAHMDGEMERVGRILLHHFRSDENQLLAPSGGAAGGLGFGLRAALGVPFISGIELVWQWLDMKRRVVLADVVMTGEGRFDSSSLSGKGPGEIIRRAAISGKRAVLFAGSVDRAAIPLFDTRMGASVELCAITPECMSLADALKQGELLLADSVKSFFV